MAEKIPKPRTENVETKEKVKSDVTTALLSPDDKTEGFEETGYGSAPGSSDVMSGAESSVWTSDDHGPEDTKIQQVLKPEFAITTATSGGLDIATKRADVIKKPSKKPKLGFIKKASPVSKRVASTAELTENLIPPEEEDKEKSSFKTRSRSKFTSGLPKLVSLRKSRNTDKSQSCSPTMQEKDVKASPNKSPVKKLSSGIPTSVTSKKHRLKIPLQDEEHGLSTEKEKTAKSPRSPKSTPASKGKSSMQATSVQSKHRVVPPQTAESEKAGECSVKPKRAHRFSLGKFKTTKQDTTAETPLVKQSSSTETKSDSSSATSSAFALVRKGIKKMDVSGKLRKSTKKAEETRLIEKDKKAAKTASAQREDESSEDRSLNEPYVFKETSWKPLNAAQGGGFLDEDVIVYLSSSEKDTTPTEMSTLSDSSSLIRGKSKSQRSRHRTLDSLSKISSFEEEVECTAEPAGNTRPQLQRQTNVSDLEMEDDPGDVFDSPEHKVTVGKKSHETKE